MDAIEAIVAATRGRKFRPALRRALKSGSVEDWQALNSICASEPAAADMLCAAALKARRLRHDSQEKLLAAALSLSPWHVDATLAMAKSYLARGLVRQAHKLLADLRKHRAAQNEPESASLDEALLSAAQAAGMSDDARAAAYRLAVSEKSPWSALLAAGEFFRTENDLDAQRTLFTRMTRARPNNPDANLLMAAWLHDEGFDKEAQKFIRRAIAHSPSREQRMRAEHLLFEIGFPEQAAEFRKLTQSFFALSPGESLPFLRKLTRAHPELAEAWLFYGFALRRDRQLEQAMRAFERCVKLSDDPNAHKELAAIFGEIREPRLAEKHARRALELLGDHDKISWLNLASALADLRKPAQAREALEKARALDPSSNQLAQLEQSINARSKPERGFYNARLVRL